MSFQMLNLQVAQTSTEPCYGGRFPDRKFQKMFQQSPICVAADFWSQAYHEAVPSLKHESISNFITIVLIKTHLIFISTRAIVNTASCQNNARPIDGEANCVRSKVSSVPSFAVITFLESDACRLQRIRRYHGCVGLKIISLVINQKSDHFSNLHLQCNFDKQFQRVFLTTRSNNSISNYSCCFFSDVHSCSDRFWRCCRLSRFSV